MTELVKDIKTCAVIVSAYKADAFIMDMINAMRKQTIPDGWQVKFYIGVDGCRKTFKLLKSKGIDFYYYPKNVGTYVMANSLMQEARDADVITRFDADDIPGAGYFVKGLSLVEQCGYVRSVVLSLNPNVKNHSPFYSNGQFFITKKVLSVVNAFDDYRVSGDHALMLKMKANGYYGMSDSPIDLANMPVVHKRWHSESISSTTSNEERGLIHKQIDDRIANKDFFVNNPKTVKLIKHLSSAQ